MITVNPFHVVPSIAAKPLLRGALAALLVSVSGVAQAQVKEAPVAQKKADPAAAAVKPPEAKAPPAAALPPRAPSGDVVARAGDNELTRDEIRALVSTLSPNEQAALAADPALFSQTLRIKLANQLVLKEALAKKWAERPQVAAQLQRARDNTIVESYLQSISAPPADYPSEADLAKAYEANKAALAVPRTFQVAQIFIALADGADKDAQDKAAKKLADVEAKLTAPNADFGAIAKAESDEPASGARGGEIGWLAEAQMKPEIRVQVVALAKGAVSAPVKADGGWHLLKVLDITEAGTRTLAEVKDVLRQRLRAQRVEEARRAHLSKLLEQSPPTINELALSNVLDQPRQ